MKQKLNQGGRPPKLNPRTFRYVVRFDAMENDVFLKQFEKSNATAKSTFIKNVLLGKPFKVYVIDENTRSFIDLLSNMNNRYRSICIEYDQLVKTLKESLNEKKVKAVLGKLEGLTVEVIKLNREIVALAKRFDEQWSQKSTSAVLSTDL